MRAVRLIRPFEVKLDEIPTPKPSPDEALIRVKAAGICGSDVAAYRGTNPLVSYPRVIGHEIAGEVIECPENDRGIKPGDAVVLEPYVYCGRCYPCSIGRTNCCESLKVRGVHVDGGMSEMVSHPVHLLHKVEGIRSWEEMVMIEPLSIALHGLRRARLQAGEHLLLFGGGQIGQLAVQAARAMGAKPILVEPLENRRELALELGVERAIEPGEVSKLDLKPPVAIEASGSPQALLSAISAVSHAARLVMIGWVKGEIPIETATLIRKEIELLGSRNSAGEFPIASEMIAEGKVKVKPLITEVVDMDGAPEILGKIAEEPGRYVKVIVKL
jgi:2-desacetyl-2-hydroxyethyl bacteriochlorophyllide A dehydrogenase